MKLGVLPTNAKPGKYDRIFGPYEYDPRHENGPTCSIANRAPSQKSKTEKKLKKKKIIPKVSRPYQSRNADHWCKDCLPNVGNQTMRFEPLNCRILIPHRRRFALVRRRLQMCEPDYCTDSIVPTLQNQQDMRDGDVDLKSWIFTPTHGRSLNGNLNLTHNMVDDKTGKFKSFIHVLVVQKSQFEAYAERWGSSHVIVELPEYLQEHIPDVTAEVGKVGYARRFIQLLAEKFELDTIFMVDDNIPHLYDIETTTVNGKSIIKMDGNEVKRKNAPLYRVLKHIESQFDGSKNPPTKNFQPHTGVDAENQLKLEGFTGPSEKYGVIGILKNSKFSSRVCNPFNNAHVCGLTFLNIHALREHEIKFQAWPVWEDLTLNNDCDRNGLFVAKYNRFVCFKRNIPSWLPEVYIWNDQTFLKETDCKSAKPAERSAEILLHYIQSWAAPQYCRLWSEKGLENVPDMKSLRDMIQHTKAFKHHIVFFYPTTTLKIVEDYLTRIPGLGYFNRHIMVFPIAACWEFQLHTVSTIQSTIVNSYFTGENGAPRFEVVTSHNINHYKVEMLLVYVEGKGKGNIT